MNVINFKDKTEFYWPECEHIIKSNDDVDCPYCRIAELEDEVALLTIERDNLQRERCSPKESDV